MLALLAGAAAAPASAEPADSYTYDYWGKAAPAPSPYVLQRTVSGRELGIASFSSPRDLYAGPEGRLYIADTGNNRIVVLDADFRVERIVSSFDRGGAKDSLKQPEGVFADEKGRIYVADTGNRRLVELTAEGKWVREIGAPQSTLLRQGFQYTPVKVSVDRADRIYVVSRGSYEGIIELDSDGAFESFVGTNRVKFSPADLFWKRISTKAQRDQMALFVPLEFNNLDLDEDGFLYTTTSEENADRPLKRLNPAGADILRSRGYFPPKGDVHAPDAGSTPGSSILVDVAADEGGMYSVLDSKRGRIFAYDKDGNLLYEFGGLGSRRDKFRTPSALDMLGDRAVVLDQDNARISVFEPTRYGSMIREAVVSLYNGQAEASSKAWSEVLRMNANMDVAYIGLGKSLLKRDESREAMAYFKLGGSRDYYSEAFKRYRQEYVLDHFGKIVLGIAAAAVVAMAAVRIGRRRFAGRHYEEIGIIRNPFYTMTHPFNGFWEMKFEQKGRVKVALGILLLLTFLAILKAQYSGFVVNGSNPREFNSLDELKFILLPFALWCVANWSLTTLMDGEGKFREIVTATGYALMPFVVVYLPQLLYSRVITADESSFYYLLDAIAMIWFVWLLFVGTMTVHQYSAGKTAVTMLLTLVVIGILMFLGVLFFSMLQQMLSFAVSIYKELSFRY